MNVELFLTKMEGLGNDFILADDRDGLIATAHDYGTLARELCDRHLGVGADGLILAVQPVSCDVGFRIFNSDGSEPEMCGNGMRCFAKYLYEKEILRQKVMSVETKAGVITPVVEVDEEGLVAAVRVDMGPPEIQAASVPFLCDEAVAVNQPLTAEGTTWEVTAVSMGNPHAVIFTEDVASIDLAAVGPGIETHPFFPEKTNVEFVTVLAPDEMRMRVWERGAGITLACGTGACAVAVAGVLSGRTGRVVRIHLPGGDLLIEWDEKSGHLFKTGPARLVFETCYRT